MKNSTRFSPQITLATAELATPIGSLQLAACAQGLVVLLFPDQKRIAAQGGTDKKAQAHIDAAQAALADYFDGREPSFAGLSLAPQGTEFQKSVWRQLSKIPYGKTRSYGEIANAVGNPKATRAVGLANGRNPLPIIVPCHRVIGANGKLTGFSGGIAIKQYLLELEGVVSPDLLSPAQRTG